MSAVFAWIAKNRPQLRLALRILIAALATFAIGQVLGLVQAYWAVLTAVVVSQASVGGSIKATRERFVGSVGGAAWGVAASLSLPHRTDWGLAAVLTVALAPLALVSAINPAYRIAPVTAIILLLAPSGRAAGPFAAGMARLTEIALGSVVGLAVALLVLPERAHGAAARSAAKALPLMGQLTVRLAAGLAAPLDADAVHDLNARIRKIIAAVEASAEESLRERRLGVLTGVDPAPLGRTLRRLHQDLLMLGRAAREPVATPIAERLDPSAQDAAAAIDGFLRQAGEALAAQTPAPGAARLEQALDAFAEAVAQVRAERLTRELPHEMVGRIFGFSFALEQLRANLRDLADRTDEFARESPMRSDGEAD